MNKKKPTAMQVKVLKFCLKFLEENDQFPTAVNIAANFDFRSPNASTTHMQAIERMGFFERNVNGKYKRGKRKLEADA
jgi:SOS-response transcriptional repressor LexA